MINLLRTDTGYGLNRTAGSPDSYGRAGFGAGAYGFGAGMPGGAGIAAGSSGSGLGNGSPASGTMGTGTASVGAGMGAGTYQTASAAGANAAGTSAAGTSAAGTSAAGGAMGAGKAGVGAASGTQATQATGCETCRSRKYQDISTDAGVSFKAPANIDPSVAAAAVMSHEREHVALAEGRADAEGGQVIASITLETAICEECGRVYVSGGKAHITTVTPVNSKAEQVNTPETALPGARKAEDALPVLPGARKSEDALPVLPGAKKAEDALPVLPGTGRTEQTPQEKKADAVRNPLPHFPGSGASLRLDNRGTDQFRKQYMQTMAGNFGLFFDSRM